MNTLEYLPLFSPGYWRAAWRQASRLRQLTLAALICALMIAVSGVYVPVGANLRVKFTFLFAGLGAAIYGPVVAMMVGFVSDVLGYMLFPSGAFFPGYTLSAMLQGLCYGLFFYRQRVTVLRIFAAKALVNYGVNVLLGSVWSAMLYSKGYYYYVTASLVKNTLLLPVEVAALALLYRFLLPQLARLGVLPAPPAGQAVVPLWKRLERK